MKKYEIMQLLANYNDNDDIKIDDLLDEYDEYKPTIRAFMRNHENGTRYTIFLTNGDILGTLIKGNGTIDAFNRYVCELDRKVLKFESFGRNYRVTVEA